MLKARAVGGPRHNVVIEAPTSWTGQIEGAAGRYVWKYQQWVWRAQGDDPPLLPRKRSKATSTKKKRRSGA